MPTHTTQASWFCAAARNLEDGYSPKYKTNFLNCKEETQLRKCVNQFRISYKAKKLRVWVSFSVIDKLRRQSQ